MAFTGQILVYKLVLANLQHGRRSAVALTKSCRLCLGPVVLIAKEETESAEIYKGLDEKYNSRNLTRVAYNTLF